MSRRTILCSLFINLARDDDDGFLNNYIPKVTTVKKVCNTVHYMSGSYIHHIGNEKSRGSIANVAHHVYELANYANTHRRANSILYLEKKAGSGNYIG